MSEEESKVNITLKSQSVSRSVVPDSLRPHRLYTVRLFCPWNSPGKSTGVGGHSWTQGSNLYPSALQANSLPSEPPGKPILLVMNS